MAGATQQRGTAWKRRQGSASEQVRADLEETIRENRAKAAAASDGGWNADFNDRLAKAQVFAQKQGLAWTGPITHGMAAALVEFRAARANHLIQGLAARIAELEKVIAGQQKHVDHLNRHALTFAGEWQTTSTYHEGNLVSHKGALYTAMRQIPPGKSAPSTRDGSGWALMA